MSSRLDRGGRLIDRGEALEFRFNGRRMKGFAGDTLASALLANDQMLVGRSFKYHRPRGIVASGVEEPNALVSLGTGPCFEPNRQATTALLDDGMIAVSQNHWPSLDFDIGATNDCLARFLPAGFYYKTFIHPRAAWKHLFEPLIRRSAGLGRAPTEPDADRYEYVYAHCDLLVAGGGVAGLQAARIAAAAGARIIIAEQAPHWGGRTPTEGDAINDGPAEDWIAATVEELRKSPHVTLLPRTVVAGVHDHGYVLAEEHPAVHARGDRGPRKRLWRIRARKILAATGAHERPLAFPKNDVPGVMLASAVRDYVVDYGVSPGARTVIVTNNDDAYRTAIALHEAGLAVPAIVDVRKSVNGPLPERARALGIRIREERGIIDVRGGKRVRSVSVGLHEGRGGAGEEIACDVLAMSGGWSPAVHLWSHCGGKLLWDAERALFRPDPARPPLNHDGRAVVVVAGAANGALTTARALADGAEAGASVVAELGLEQKTTPVARACSVEEMPLEPVWMMPASAGPELRSKMWLDYQNDVKVSDVHLAAREGFESVEHAKRYTTLGMATDQGKTSNINGLAVLADVRDEEIPRVGTTTFRPPYVPLTIGALIGEAHGDIFQPLQCTAMHDWHLAQGAYMEPVGHWQRPYTYPRQGESHADAVNREVLNTRTNVGILDTSTLGKIIVQGPDAGRFLDMLYTNKMSTLKVGRCRYGLMCNEQGFLMDDGVVARLGEETFLCHTTSGGAAHTYAWMEEWLQCEWWDWKVFTANVTEHYVQIGIVGPKAREVLEKLGGMDVSKEALPFMGFADGTLAGIPVRAYRISFSGELSYELATPAGNGLALWHACLDAGREFGMMPYGTEALHVLRAAKGFIIIGDETDGTVTPLDLNLGWAVSKKKDDFLGKRGMERSFLAAGDRWQLVGFEALDGSVIPDGAYVRAEGIDKYGFRGKEGRITSTYWSEPLKKGIALGLLKNGADRLGEDVEFEKLDGSVIRASVVSPVFYDPEGERQNV